MTGAKWLLPFLSAAVLAMGCGDANPSRLTAPEAARFTEHACELGVSDEAALALIELLITAVDELAADGSLSSGQANALRNHLLNARRHIEAGRYCPALAQLNAFREQVGNFVDDGVLDPDDAAPLLGGAADVITGLPNLVTIGPPSSAAGAYDATGAAFGPAPSLAGVTAPVVLVNDGSTQPTLACEPLLGFPAGAIALIERGTCLFVSKVLHAQAAGAVAVIVMNNVAGPPLTMGGAAPEIVIPSVMISLDDAATIRAWLPAIGTVSRKPLP